MQASKIRSKRNFWTFLGGVSIVHESKECKIKLKLASQSMAQFLSRQVWLIPICQSILCSLRMRRIWVEIFSMILQLPFTMSTKTYELLSTWRCAIHHWRAMSIRHISACRVSEALVCRAQLIICFSLLSGRKMPHPERLIELLCVLSQLSLIHPSQDIFYQMKTMSRC